MRKSIIYTTTAGLPFFSDGIWKYFHVHFCVCVIYKHVFKCGDGILGVVTRILQPESIVLKKVTILSFFCLTLQNLTNVALHIFFQHLI